jgi:sucrose-6-phosphate hydrolase SacC (GH32 family)
MKPILILLCSLLPLAASAQRADLVIADFEGPNYGDWKTTGTAFGPGPAQGTLPGQMQVSGYLGHGLVNSYHGGDASTGTLTSPPFNIERSFIQFLIGGGMHPGETCMNLLVEGKVVRTATGPNDRPGGTERLDRQSWDVRDLAGRTAVIEIVDKATGGWGHINVDQIVQTDHKLPDILANVKREFKISQRYLNLPIRNDGPHRKVTLLVDGSEEVVNTMELSDHGADWWAFIDVSAWHGKTVTLIVDHLSEDSEALSAIKQSDEIKDAKNLYHEPLRAQFHFSARRGWINDPNGLVFFRGEYHLFFQHNPYGWRSDNQHWGHAVSRDLVHWQELPEALAPDKFGPMWSGSAVVDWQNTSGLGAKDHPPMALLYAAAGNPSVQCLATSTDGRNIVKFSGNPVVPQITHLNRDPKVIWHEPSKQWIMCLYVELNRVHTIHFFGSPNLKDWKLLSTTDGFFECPDFFELPVSGKEHKWVLTAASSEYKVGTFDGRAFTPETPKLPGHRGQGFYAAQTYSDIPAKDGRRIQIGWLQTETPGMSFNQAQTIPLELNLVSTPDGPRLTWTPVKELTTLRAKSKHIKQLTLAPDGPNPLAALSPELVELRAEFEPGNAETSFTVHGATIAYDAHKQELTVNGHRAPAPLRDGCQRLTIYCDRTALEIFASDGLTYVPMPYIPKAGDRCLEVHSKRGAVKFMTLEVHELKSAWPAS